MSRIASAALTDNPRCAHAKKSHNLHKFVVICARMMVEDRRSEAVTRLAATEDTDVAVNQSESARVSRRTMFGEMVAAMLGAPALATDVFRPGGMAAARAEEASSPISSEAERMLRLDQKKSPPLYSSQDGVASLWRRLRLRGILARLMGQAYRNGRFAVGEIGDVTPRAFTKPVGRPGHPYYVVEITSGMLDFTYAFGVGILEPDGAKKAADVLRRWLEYSNQRVKDFFVQRSRLDREIFSLPASELEIQEQVIVCANLFLLCHELGHVALNLGFVKAEGKAADFREELKADLVGLEMYWQSTAPRPMWIGKDLAEYWSFDLRLVMAGYGLSVRLRESLARMGVKFSDQYGDARARLELGLAKLRELCPSDQYFDELSTVLLATLKHLDKIDLDLTGRAKKPWIDNQWNRWESLASLIGVSLSVVNDKRPKLVWLGVVEQEVNRLDAEDAKHVVRMLCQYYVDPRPRRAFIEDAKRRQMGSAIREMVPDLPPTMQQLFELP